MTHTPAVDSLEHINNLQHLRRMVPSVNQREALDAAITALTRPPGGSERLREALESIEQYGSDTLSGRTDGPDDRQWQRAAVVEMTRRATAALASPQGAEQRQECMCHEGNGARNCSIHTQADFDAQRPESAATQGDAVPVDALENLALCELGAAEISPEDADAISQHIVALRKRAESAETKLAALSSPPGVQAAQVSPKLIGWRSADYLMETADKAVALNWQGNVEVLPIFAGDPNTKLAQPGSAAHGGEDAWIPVCERLPENDSRDVITYSEHSGKQGVMPAREVIYGSRMAAAEEDAPYVTHWRPLLAAPQENPDA